ncbi:MAG: LysR family transcriptional regulator [Nitratireductor sp.]|nr:LysR family transcriptional regulator [Nitratireductor sp.]
MIENLKSVAVFAKVAETGSFTAAAKALKLSAPVVSQHISQLEARLDTALVYRSTRSLSLTDAGQRFAIHARRMLDAMEDGFEELADETESPKGTLSVALPALILDSAFMDGLAEYVRRYPDIQLRLSFDDAVKDLVKEGYDLAIRGGVLEDSTLKARKLLQGELLPVGSPGLLEALGPISQPSDLEADHIPWIGAQSMNRKLAFRRIGGGNEVQHIVHKNKIVVDNSLGALKLIERGVGIGYAPRFYLQNHREPGLLAPVLPDWVTEPVGIYAVWPANSGSRSLSRHFVSFISEEFLPNLPQSYQGT